MPVPLLPILLLGGGAAALLLLSRSSSSSSGAGTAPLDVSKGATPPKPLYVEPQHHFAGILNAAPAVVMHAETGHVFSGPMNGPSAGDLLTQKAQAADDALALKYAADPANYQGQKQTGEGSNFLGVPFQGAYNETMTREEEAKWGALVVSGRNYYRAHPEKDPCRCECMLWNRVYSAWQPNPADGPHEPYGCRQYVANKAGDGFDRVALDCDKGSAYDTGHTAILPAQALACFPK